MSGYSISAYWLVLTKGGRMGMMEDLKKDTSGIDINAVAKYAEKNGIKDAEEAKQKYMEMKANENK